jgi:mono/diheme cytochrome c family protein/plastocyanin
MKPSLETFARLLALAALLAVPLLVIALRPAAGQVIEIRGRMPENGGWTPDRLTVEAGQPLHLRLTSDDVVHSFAIGQSDHPVIDLLPGEVVETTLVFDTPGKYTFYCTRWCGANHWRMRGVIDVTGPVQAGPRPPAPLFEQLGIDIDAPHPAEAVPEERPSASRAQELGVELPAEYAGQERYRASSPAETWQSLRKEPSLAGLSGAALWDLTALIWERQTGPQELQRGREIYQQNCAACHGENGQGDGVMAKYLEAAVEQLGAHTSMPGTGGLGGQHGIQSPSDFSDPDSMLGASPALLQGKIVRGGMGTGMPYWGPVLTEAETWAVTAYLWAFQFESELLEQQGRD